MCIYSCLVYKRITKLSRNHFKIADKLFQNKTLWLRAKTKAKSSS